MLFQQNVFLSSSTWSSYHRCRWWPSSLSPLSVVAIRFLITNFGRRLVIYVSWIFVYVRWSDSTSYRWSAVLTRYSMTWYCQHHCTDWDRIYNKALNHKRHPITDELCGVFGDDLGENWPRYIGITLYIWLRSRDAVYVIGCPSQYRPWLVVYSRSGAIT